ncbi:type 1 fimbrial protein [Pantoea sp. BAV 3049]|uniref:type 1 fimbrial protein n=1 Tax=Pantoea sp. BAV 3049 TaxID=2654188 RepID=UPI0018EEEAAC|nr:type 1 fimbrial protein [Pantoea sp. BAV 3049]
MNGIKVAMIVMLFTSWTSSTQAADSSSGIIEFRGAIVEPGCDMELQQNQITSSCYRDGKTRTTVSSLKGKREFIPTNVGKSDIRWLDQHQKQGIMTVSYN